MTRYYYLDTSVAVRILLRQSDAAAAWFDEASGDSETVVFSSRLLRTELTRVLRREQLPVSRRDEILDYLSLVALDDSVLAESEAIVPHIKTLDAIHVASLIRSGLDATLITHDANMSAVAAVIGYPVFDPVNE